MNRFSRIRPLLIRACSYGQKLSLLPRKHCDRSNNVLFIGRNVFPLTVGKISRCDVDFVKCEQKVFPLSGKVVFICDENYLGTRENFSSHMNAMQLFILFHNKTRSRL